MVLARSTLASRFLSTFAKTSSIHATFDDGYLYPTTVVDEPVFHGSNNGDMHFLADGTL